MRYFGVSVQLIQSWTHLHNDPLFGIAVLLVFGLVGGKLIQKIGFPRITGYILIGIIVGPSIFNLVTDDMLHAFFSLRQVAVAFIGYTIGLELRISKLKKTGKQVVVITFTQAITTAIIVALVIGSVLSILNIQYAWVYGLILGSIATATAPGPILAVVKNYRTKGPVTDVLLPLVALDDAIGIMVFAIFLSIGSAMLSGPISVSEMIFEPSKEIFLSLLIGFLIGLILTFALKRNNRENDNILLIMVVGAVFAGTAFSQAFHASEILLPMTTGMVVTNLIDEKYEQRITKSTDLFSAPILLIFFALAGAELHIANLMSVGLIGVLYIISRVTGKYIGTSLSARAVKAPKTVVTYLGIMLLPQAGVAVNMALATVIRFEETPALLKYVDISETIMTVVLAATVVYEILGLAIVKWAFGKAGEIDMSVDHWA